MAFDPIAAAHQANFVEFAYNMYAAGGLTPTPDAGIAAAGYQLMYWLNAHDFNELAFYGYIAQSTDNPGNLVLAIRGTEDPAEWILDLLAIPVPFTSVPSAGFVALGFLSIFQTFTFVDSSNSSHTLLDALTHLNSGNAIQSLTIIGHSLGGALATLAAAEIAVPNSLGLQNVMTVWTFASPRVGLMDFAVSFDKAVDTSFRVWNQLDIVPQLPLWPYVHVSGNGNEIVQTQQQLETLLHTPLCQHELTSYQWLLDPAEFALPAGCDAATAPQLTVTTTTTVTEEITSPAGVARLGLTSTEQVGVHKLGARALHRAMYGHL
jgi:hypothetical protein